MNVLVTGANGFIGRALCRLSADGYKVRGMVRGQEKTEVGGWRSEIRCRKSEAGNRKKTEIAPVKYAPVESLRVLLRSNSTG
jgi:nucleoside-diphosphate-sugar epimerase